MGERKEKEVIQEGKGGDSEIERKKSILGGERV